MQGMEAQESNNILHIDIDLKIYCDQKIGRGAFGVVFRGIYKEAICAVKVLHDVATTMTSNLPIKSAGNEEPVTKAFNQECTFLKSFKHPNIVKHLSTTHHPTSNNLILVTEVLDCSLRAYFSLEGYGTKSLTISCETSLSKDVAAGLAYIHGKRIIHRDLCGDNILLRLGKQNELPMAKISDFGMSRILDPSRLSSTLTAMGHRMGYLPPEAPRIDNEEYDHSLDVFSLGAVMVQIVCKLETVKSPATRSYYVAQIPDTHLLKPLIVECLQKEKDKRPLAETLSNKLGRLNALEKWKSSTNHSEWTKNELPVQLLPHQSQVQPLPQQRMPKVNVFFWVSKHILPILLLIILAVMSIYYSDDLFANSDIYKFKGVYGDFPILKFFYNTAVTVATAGFVYIYFT